MDAGFILIQTMNGIQYGLLLFLIASGLTLILGIMDIINLAHGALYMVGAYLAWWLTAQTGHLVTAILLALPLAILLGVVIERLLIDRLYGRSHLDQVLLTFGLILILDATQSILWGDDVHSVPVPDVLGGSLMLTSNLSYPVYRVFLSVVCLAIALAMWYVIQRTRLGMIVRAGARNREMVSALGIDVRRVYTIVFAVGAALAAFAGMIAAPIASVFPGMGTGVLIIGFVVVVIGGLGSIKGAFIGALLVGLVQTWGTVLVPSLASAVIYALMAAVLLWRPRGLFA